MAKLYFVFAVLFSTLATALIGFIGQTLNKPVPGWALVIIFLLFIPALFALFSIATNNPWHQEKYESPCDSNEEDCDE